MPTKVGGDAKQVVKLNWRRRMAWRSTGMILALPQVANDLIARTTISLAKFGALPARRLMRIQQRHFRSERLLLLLKQFHHLPLLQQLLLLAPGRPGFGTSPRQRPGGGKNQFIRTILS